MKYFALILAMLFIVGCSDDETVVSDYPKVYEDENRTVVCTTPLNCTEYWKEKPIVFGVYDPTYNPQECNEAGFFFCTIEMRCLQTTLESLE